MKSIFQKIYDIGYVLSRKDVLMGEKYKLLFDYYGLGIKHKFSKENTHTSVKFLTYKISTPAFENLRGILREIFILGDYVYNTKKTHPTIIDCGGNIGISVLFFKHVYPNARMTVFEPSESNFKYLIQNIENNTLSNVTPIHSAVGKNEGTIIFWEAYTKPGGSTSVKEVYEAKDKEKFIETVVPCTKLSKYIDCTVDLLKIDIEGGEGVVLEELEESGKLTLIQEIILEYHYNLSNKENNLGKILTLLERNNYKVIIFANEFGISSEKLKSQKTYHTMLRAVKV